MPRHQLSGMNTGIQSLRQPKPFTVSLLQQDASSKQVKKWRLSSRDDYPLLARHGYPHTLVILVCRTCCIARSPCGSCDGNTALNDIYKACTVANWPRGHTTVRPGNRFWSDPLKQRGDTLTATDAQGGHGIATTDALELMESLDSDNGTGSANGMAEGNS